jgi:colicin import membrane protein
MGSSTTIGAMLLGACLLLSPAVRAEEPKDKSLTEQAREQAQKRVRDLQDAERSARQELKKAEQKVRQAEQQLKNAAADAKQAAETALSEAKQALERAKLEASSAGTMALEAVRDLKNAGKHKLDATLETAHTKAHDATDKAVGKAAELKAGVAEAAAKARNGAEGTAEEVAAEAGATVRNVQAKAHQIMQTAVGATGENARRRHARRMAWRQLADQVERPQDVPPAVREELRRHAQRTARLKRIRTLANEKREAALTARADTLIAREEQRHAKKLATLWSAMHAQRDTDRVKLGEDEDQDPAEEPAEEEEEQQ